MQTPEETLALAQRLVPRLGLAAGAAAAPPRLRGALRFRLPDPAHGGRQSRSTARRAAEAISPTCTPGARSICPAPAGSGSTRPRACSPARATSRSPARRSRRARRRSAASPTSARSTFAHEMTVDARARSAARHQALHRRAVGRRSSALGRRVDADLPATTCASRWAASRPSSRSTIATAPNGTPRRSGPSKRTLGSPAAQDG